MAKMKIVDPEKRKLYSNPTAGFYFEGDKVAFTYDKKGDIPFCVRVSEQHWLPINVMVFSDTEKNAVQVVKDVIAWMVERAKEKSYHKSNIIFDMAKCASIEVQRVEQNQLFKIGWATNDTFG